MSATLTATSRAARRDIVLRTPVTAVAGVFEGPEGIRRFFADIEDAGPDFRIEVVRLDAASDDHVLAFLRVSMTGRVSGVPVALETANIYELAGGRIARIDIYTDRSDALEALGLLE
jgi:ketosteroid isomerase-like protein